MFKIKTLPIVLLDFSAGLINTAVEVETNRAF